MELTIGMTVLCETANGDIKCKVSSSVVHDSIVQLEQEDGHKFWENIKHVKPVAQEQKNSSESNKENRSELDAVHDLIGKIFVSQKENEIALVTGAVFESRSKKKKQWYLQFGTGKSVSLDSVAKYYKQM